MTAMRLNPYLPLANVPSVWLTEGVEGEFKRLLAVDALVPRVVEERVGC